jgi:hypothetical protein
MAAQRDVAQSNSCGVQAAAPYKLGDGALSLIRLAAALAMLAAGVQDSPAPLDVTVQVSVQQSIVFRVPRGEVRVPASSGAVRWREAAAPRCIPARMVVSAVPTQGTVDLVMRDNRRFRAQLAGPCGALDYYRGVYIQAQMDGQICAQRDAVRSRMGSHCAITQLRQLHPVRP